MFSKKIITSNILVCQLLGDANFAFLGVPSIQLVVDQDLVFVLASQVVDFTKAVLKSLQCLYFFNSFQCVICRQCLSILLFFLSPIYCNFIFNNFSLKSTYMYSHSNSYFLEYLYILSIVNHC